MLPGIVYKNWILNAGLNFLFIVNTTNNEMFLRNSITYIAYKTSAIKELSSVINITMPFSISYQIPIAETVCINPFISYELGVGDMDGYAVNWNRREEAFLTELIAGINLTIAVKK